MTTERTLLIADDNATMREVIRRACARSCDKFVEAVNGREAVAAYSIHQPDWAVIDIKMPVMDGLSATREIRRQFPQARIVIITQSDDAVWEEEARVAGANNFLIKDDLTRLDTILNQTSLDQPKPNHPSQGTHPTGL